MTGVGRMQEECVHWLTGVIGVREWRGGEGKGEGNITMGGQTNEQHQ